MWAKPQTLQTEGAPKLLEHSWGRPTDRSAVGTRGGSALDPGSELPRPGRHPGAQRVSAGNAGWSQAAGRAVGERSRPPAVSCRCPVHKVQLAERSVAEGPGLRAELGRPRGRHSFLCSCASVSRHSSAGCSERGLWGVMAVQPRRLGLCPSRPQSPADCVLHAGCPAPSGPAFGALGGLWTRGPTPRSSPGFPDLSSVPLSVFQIISF